jgi:hypothetical protein
MVLHAVLWMVNGTRLGGMTSGGLGGRDGGDAILGGLAATLWQPLGKNFEPHAAEDRIVSMVMQVRHANGLSRWGEIAAFCVHGEDNTELRRPDTLAAVHTLVPLAHDDFANIIHPIASCCIHCSVQ